LVTTGDVCEANEKQKKMKNKRKKTSVALKLGLESTKTGMALIHVILFDVDV
jgi:hypothetical protein